MKKIIISLALLFSVGNIMAQTPEEKAALKEAKKEAQTCLSEAQKIKDVLEPKINDKSAGDPEVLEKYSKAIQLMQKALNTKTIEEKKFGEIYKMISEFAQPINNIIIGKRNNLSRRIRRSI